MELCVFFCLRISSLREINILKNGLKCKYSCRNEKKIFSNICSQIVWLMCELSYYDTVTEKTALRVISHNVYIAIMKRISSAHFQSSTVWNNKHILLSHSISQASNPINRFPESKTCYDQKPFEHHLRCVTSRSHVAILVTLHPRKKRKQSITKQLFAPLTSLFS